MKTINRYLIYEKFTVYTDHSEFYLLMNITESSARLIRWSLRIAELDFDIKYKKGKEKKLADAMSRLHTTGETAVGDDDDIPSLHITRPTLPTVPERTSDTLDEEEPTKAPDFIEQEFADEYRLLLTQETPKYDTPPFTPITSEELLTSQLKDAFCSETRRHLERGCCCSLKSMMEDFFFRPYKIPHKFWFPITSSRRYFTLTIIP